MRGAESPPDPGSARTLGKLGWIAVIYFASGLPYGFLTDLIPVYLRQAGVDLPTVGEIASNVGWAYVLKFLWSPLVDRLGRRKHWIVAMQLLMGAALLGMVAIDPGSAGRPLVILLITLSVLSATQDVAIDGYTIELLDQRELGPANSARVAMYRIALLVAGGAFAALVAPLGWRGVFVTAAAVMFALGAMTLFLPSRARRLVASEAGRGRESIIASGWNTIREPLRNLLSLPHVAIVLIFVLTFKIGDYAMIPMIGPFWVDAGYSTSEIGLLRSVGIGATVAGAVVGGLYAGRIGVFRALWTLGLLQAVSNLGYVWAATTPDERWIVYGAAAFEQFAGGLGTAAFLTYLMAISDKRYAATQFAILSALFSLGRLLIWRVSGEWAESLGYTRYFLLTFLLALPAYALLPWVRRSTVREVEVVREP